MASKKLIFYLILISLFMSATACGGGGGGGGGNTNVSGSLDTTFGTNGLVSTPVGTVGLRDDFGRGMAIQADGKIVAVGNISNGTGHVFAVVRYNTDGSLDENFGTSGKVTTTVGTQMLPMVLPFRETVDPPITGPTAILLLFGTIRTAAWTKALMAPAK